MPKKAKGDNSARSLLKITAIRIVMACAYLVVSLLGSPASFTATLIGGSIFALTFALAAIYFTGRSLLFVTLTVLLITVAFPLVILCEIGMPMYHSWAVSATNVIHSLLIPHPFHSLYMLAPTIAALLMCSAAELARAKMKLEQR